MKTSDQIKLIRAIKRDIPFDKIFGRRYTASQIFSEINRLTAKKVLEIANDDIVLSKFGEKILSDVDGEAIVTIDDLPEYKVAKLHRNAKVIPRRSVIADMRATASLVRTRRQQGS